ncbi:MAG: trehalose-phosphatase [candidate division Zixibacteria bacterium]|nr:trehalose-phosphatase [candidate division Zixibacteria bacterium]
MIVACETEKILETFFKKLKKARQRILFLDYDGTLAPFRTERDKAVPYPGVTERLEQIIASGKTRLIIISGRWSKDLKPLLKLKKYPEIWGCHGAERLYPDNNYELVALEEKIIKGLVDADEWARSEGLDRYYEKKPTSLAFHWRGQDKTVIENIREKVLNHWRQTAKNSGLVLHEFDGGIELRARGIDKGEAVKTILDEVGPKAVLAYLGDDITDEDAFAALAERGLRVLVRSEQRATKADIRLEPPEELLQFLDDWLKASK